jgi:hypothetical protein
MYVREERHVATWGNPQPDATADLEKLAAELDGQAYAVNLVAPVNGRPHLRIANRAAAQLTENVYCDGGFYWWGWAERIGPVADVAAVAAIIARVLRVLDAAR